VGAEGELLVCRWGRPAGVIAPTTIVPDGCVDVVWAAGRLIFAGPDTGPVIADASPGVPVAGVRLRMWVAAPLFAVGLGETLDKRVAFADIVPAAGDQLESRLRGRDSLGAADLIAAFVLGLAGRAIHVDRVVADVGNAIIASSGLVGVDSLACSSGYSERHLRRRFNASVGYGLKTYARIVRFQNARKLVAGRRASLEQIARRAGYADHGHLTREFVALGGSPPSAILSEISKPARVGSRP
jgi:AraC-like DNA-binding protein